MNSKFEILPSYRTAYIRRKGPYGADNYNIMESLKNWAKIKGLFSEEAIIFAIAKDNPQTTKGEDCRYDACIVISNEYEIDKHDVVEEGEILGGKYAVFKIKHTAEDVENAWSQIFTQTQKEGYTIDETRPVLERYIFTMLNMNECEICVPVCHRK